MIKVGIFGGAGYTGGELLRILLHHPSVEIVFVNSKSQNGKMISDIHQDLVGETELCFGNEALMNHIDVLFLCVNHGESKQLLSEINLPDTLKIIDLSNEFRLKHDNKIGQNIFVYGLPEVYGKDIGKAQYIANPGCFATAIQLGLIPLFTLGHSVPIYSTGITGSTGAGQSLSPTSHFSWRTNNIQPYKSLTHQHLDEVYQTIQEVSTGFERLIKINFIPWRGDFARGIFVSSQTESNLSMDELYELYESYFYNAPFVHISRKPIHLKQVLNTNKCLIHIEKLDDQIVIHSTIDNLIKGASGQAVQNMNLMMGLDPSAGLNLKPIAF